MGHGGRRVGAGAKPHAYSEETKKKLNAAIKKVAKETGKTVEEILADILVKLEFKSGRVGIREWLAAFGLYLNAVVVKSSYKKIDQDIYDHRVVVLPEIKRPKDDEVAQA